MTVVLIAIVVVAALAITRFGVQRVTERLVARRLPVGPDGIVPAAASIRLSGGARDAVLLLHGYGDSPQTLRHLARELHSKGFDVYAPLLPGHGRTLRTFAGSRASEWIDGARAALDDIARDHERVGVVGLSMGGALAAILAAERREITALVLLAPYVEASPWVRLAGRLAGPLQMIVPYVYGRSARSIHDPVERRLSVGFGAGTPRLVEQLLIVADRARAALGNVTAPTLLIQSREDNHLSIAAAERTLAAIGAREKEAVWITGSGHVITVDFGWERVVTLTADWLEQWMRGRPSQTAKTLTASR